MKARILVVDDEAEIRRSVRMILEYEGYDVLEASSGPEGLALIEREAPDLVFLDIKMQGIDGLEVLQRIRVSQRDAARRDHLGSRDGEHRGRGDQGSGAFDFIEKPLSKRARARDDPQRAGSDAAPEREPDAEARGRGAPSDGRREPRPAADLGCDQARVADQCHGAPARRERRRQGARRASDPPEQPARRERFVQVNCAAIPEELIESELFGHEKGSFTGATEKQIGKFEQADRGTIFLDEVGDMSAKTQAKVLRVLQEGEVERLGSARTIKVDVRVIAATNKDLEAGDREGHVPRGSVLPSERDSDSRSAAARSPRGHPGARAPFRRSVQPREQSPTAAVRAAALDYLQKARWKGNIRELRNTVERLLIMTPGDAIDLDDLRDVVRADAARSAPAAGEPTTATVRAPSASSRNPPSGRSSSTSSAKMPGTSRKRRRSSARHAAISTKSSSSTPSRRKEG